MVSELAAERQRYANSMKPVSKKPAWHNAELPSGYEISETGVEIVRTEVTKGRTAKKGDAQQDDAGSTETVIREHISGPIWITALTKDTSGSNWGAVVNWLDRDGEMHKEAIASSRFLEQGNGLAQYFADNGLYVTPGKEQQLSRYLARFSPQERQESVDRLGWVVNDQLVFVLPKRTIGVDNVVFQPERHSPTSMTMTQSGSLEDWKREVFDRVKSEELLLFAALVGLAAPLFKFAQIESGGFHLHEQTSRGKTTALQVAASVWGCGKDPAVDSDGSFIRRWNTTQNALEGLAAAHNDTLLALDEIGTCDTKDFGKLIYDLFGGTGKSALDQKRNLKKQRTWRTSVLSTGEVSVRTKLEQTGVVKGGQMVRFCDIPVGGSVIRHASDKARFADEIKDACGRIYGTAGPAFVEALIEKQKTTKNLTETVRTMVDIAHKRLIPGTVPVPAELSRIGKRFALVEVAGVLAIEVLKLDIDIVDLRKALFTVVEAWLEEAQTTVSDGTRAIFSIRNFIQANPARFAKLTGSTVDESIRIHNLAGYYKEEDGLYLLFESAFEEACSGASAKIAIAALEAKKLLHKTEKDKRLKSRYKVGGQRPYFYAITERITVQDATRTKEEEETDEAALNSVPH